MGRTQQSDDVSSPETSDSGSPLNFQFNQLNQQINIGEIGGFEKFDALSEEVRTFAMQYMLKEQEVRHDYVISDQFHTQKLQRNGQRHGLVIQIVAAVGGLLLVVFLFGAAIYLLLHGVTAVGIALILAEIAGIVWVLRTGQKLNREKKSPSKSEE